MDAREVLDYIEDADDTTLESLASHINAIRQERRNREARRLAALLKVGDRVRIKRAGIKPKYLGGQYATVEEFKNSRVLIRLDSGPQGKFRTGKVLCPVTTLEVIS